MKNGPRIYSPFSVLPKLKTVDPNRKQYLFHQYHFLRIHIFTRR